MAKAPIQALLVDDDIDDCSVFAEALRELPISIQLSVVNNSEQLLNTLLKLSHLPSVLFMDLNMPRKNGVECISEIKAHDKLKTLPIIVYSTSLEPSVVNQLFDKGASYYIRKPAEFPSLKKVIFHAITLATSAATVSAKKENFVLE